MANEAHKSWGSIVEEATYGTTPGTGESYFSFVGEGLTDDTPIKPSKSLRDVSDRNVHQGNKVVGGDVTLEALFEGQGLFYKGAMGGYAFAADTPVADANTHTFTLADTCPSSSIELCKADVPTGKVFLYQGDKINTMNIGVTEEEVLDLVFGMIAQTETPDTTASGTPSYPSWIPILSRFSGLLTLAGTTNVAYKGGSFALDNKFERRYLLNQTTREPLRGAGKREITGSVLTEFDDLALYTKYKNGTPGSLIVIYTSDQMVTGTTPYTMTISAPKIYLTGKTPNVTGDGIVEATFDWKSIHGGATTDALTIQFVNGAGTLA